VADVAGSTRQVTVVRSVVAVALLLLLAGCRSEPIQVAEPRGTDLPADTFHVSAWEDETPLHFESYRQNLEQGGEYVSKFADDIEPNLPILWSNLAFSVEYNKPRGHVYGLEDVLESSRIGERSIGSCLTCKSTAVPTLLDELGDDYWSASFLDEIVPRALELGEGGEHPALGDTGHIGIGCSDCHDPQSMDLRITRPSFTRALEARGIDVLQATKNDMRSYVCGQCHVEYYFYPETGVVTFPWDEGLRAEDMYGYFEEIATEAGFAADWVHGVSGAPMLKAQHPEFELWSYGTHGEADVSCADCHMPYERVDGRKITNHAWGSPLERASTTCRVCHADRSASELTQRVRDIQERHLAAVADAQEISVDAHYYVNRLITADADPDVIAEAQELVREGQWFWDIIAAENSDGFHNPNGGMDAIRRSSNASNAAIRIATAELVRLDVDLDELRERIDETKQAVYDESDPLRKHEHVTNDFFPPQDGYVRPGARG
jgi:nitrite reductase (cytochrome c-552)